VSTQDDGGPAFPLVLGEGDPAKRAGYGVDGMSLRDYFAAEAMQALIIAKAPDLEKGARGWPVFAEIDAYLIADAMLKARKA